MLVLAAPVCARVVEGFALDDSARLEHRGPTRLAEVRPSSILRMGYAKVSESLASWLPIEYESGAPLELIPVSG